MTDDVPRVRKWVLVEHTLAPVTLENHSHGDTLLRTLLPLDCAFSVFSEQWGDGKSFLEQFMPVVETTDGMTVKKAATFIASRLIFNQSDEIWERHEQPYDSTVATLIVRTETLENENFLVFVRALEQRLKDLGLEQLTIQTASTMLDEASL